MFLIFSIFIVGISIEFPPKSDIFADKIHVVNYQDILSVGDEKIILSAAKQTVYFYGTSFSLSKLLDQELLIEGKLLRLEVIYE